MFHLNKRDENNGTCNKLNYLFEMAEDVVNVLQEASVSLPQRNFESLLSHHESLLESLPDELVVTLLMSMPPKTLAKTCKSSRRLRSLCEEHDIKFVLDEKSYRVQLNTFEAYLRWSISLLCREGNREVDASDASATNELHQGRERFTGDLFGNGKILAIATGRVWAVSDGEDLQTYPDPDDLIEDTAANTNIADLSSLKLFHNDHGYKRYGDKLFRKIGQNALARGLMKETSTRYIINFDDFSRWYRRHKKRAERQIDAMWSLLEEKMD